VLPAAGSQLRSITSFDSLRIRLPLVRTVLVWLVHISRSAMMTRLEAAWSLLNLVARLAYAFRHSRHSSAAHWLLGITLRRSQSLPLYSESARSGSSTRRLAMIFLVLTVRLAEWYVTRLAAIPVHASMESLLSPAVSTHPPPPPSSLLHSPSDQSLCVLCAHPPISPCASTGGAVCCYNCLLSHVRVHGTCPATGLPCHERNLVRLYSSSSTSMFGSMHPT
jgi:hypothetical protein